MRTIPAFFLAFFFLIIASSAFGNQRFNPLELHQLVKDSIDYRQDHSESLPAQLDYVHEKLLEQFPGLINERPTWIFNHTAGALGQLKILYCSASEYLIFFGTNIGTDSHSGRHRMDVWDFMLDGEMRTSLEGELESHVYRPGEVGFLPRGNVKHYVIRDSTYMLEYGRGNVASGLINGVIAPAVFINQDWLAMRRQLQECGRLYIRQLFRR
jgi:C-8 sterol isomerase